MLGEVRRAGTGEWGQKSRAIKRQGEWSCVERREGGREEYLGVCVWSEGALAAEAKAIKEVHSKKDRRFGDRWDRSGGC